MYESEKLFIIFLYKKENINNVYTHSSLDYLDHLFILSCKIIKW